MCGGAGPGGGDAIGEAAGLVGGSGLGTSTSSGNFGQGGGLEAATPMFSNDAFSNSDVAQAVGLVTSAIPFAGTVLGAMNYAGAFDAPATGDIGAAAAAGAGPGGLGGPGTGGVGTVNPGTYAGPRMAPTAPSTITTPGGSTNIIEPGLIQTGAPFSINRGRTPAEIDAANRLRLSREQAYAKQRADAEAELLKALGRRDVALTGGQDGRLTEEPKASEKFVGIPPVLGQSRHTWA